MESDHTIEDVVPCDPASDRRPLVPGLGGDKYVTEGDGGVESQASPAADATGDASTAVTAGGSGPVRKMTRGPRASRRNSSKRYAKWMTGESSVSGNRRGGQTATPPQKSGNKHNRKRVERSEFLKKEAERVELLYRQQKEGVLKLPGMSALAPPIIACMSRANDRAETGEGTSASYAVASLATPANAAHPVRDSVPHSSGVGAHARLVPVAAQAEDPSREPLTRGPDTAKAEIRYLKTSKTSKNTTAVKIDAENPMAWAQPRSSSTPRPASIRELGPGKEPKGRVCAPPGGIEAETDTTTPSCNDTPGDSGRATKRQRSSDQVSPSVASADKKLCRSGGTAAFTSPAAGTCGTVHIGTEEDPEPPPSYAAATKVHRVVVQDKGGVMMDELQATLLRKTIDKEQYNLFKENRKKPKEERRLPVFWQLPRLVRGCLRMTPRDDFTLSWLASTVECLPTLWEGSGGFRVIPESELPQYFTAVVYVPDFGEERDDLQKWPYILREFLSELNTNVNIEQWPIFKHLVRQRGQTYNHILIMGVPPHEVEILKRDDFRLAYTTASVYVKVKQNKTGDNVRASAGAAGVASTAANSVGKSKLAVAGAAAVPQEDKDWTSEAVDRLLEVDDGSEDDMSGDIMNLTILSPLSFMETDKADSQPAQSSEQ